MIITQYIKESQTLEPINLFRRLGFLGINARYVTVPESTYPHTKTLVAHDDNGKLLYEGGWSDFASFASGLLRQKSDKSNRLEDHIIDGDWKGGAISLDSEDINGKTRHFSEWEIQDCVNRGLVLVEQRINNANNQFRIESYAIAQRKPLIKSCINCAKRSEPCIVFAAIEESSKSPEEKGDNFYFAPDCIASRNKSFKTLANGCEDYMHDREV